MIVEVLYYVAGVVLLVGALFSLLAVIGILRFPDLYTRMHAASKAGTFGSGLCLLALAIACLDFGIAMRALIGFVFLVLTAPISAHLLSRAAYIAGFRPSSEMAVNDLDGSEVVKK